MRKRIYNIIEVGTEDNLSGAYDIFMMVTIIVSLIPLVFKNDLPIFTYIDRITVSIFILDYLLRWITADMTLKKDWRSFFYYPLTILAIIDLISILPSIATLNVGFKVFKVVRLLRTFRAIKVMKVFRAFRYSKNIQIIVNVFRKQKESLSVVCVLAIGYIFVSALVVFNVEPDTFDTFFDAIYWATVSLTTVGYGDIYPVSMAGQIITMISAIMGIAIVALPAGIITAGYMEEISGKGQ